MHEAYNVNPLLKQTLQIECITAYNDNLLIGTRQGHLLMYNIVKTLEDKLDVQLVRYNKTFSKKAIQQLEVIVPHNTMISLTDNIIQVHDLNVINFPVVHTVAKSKGATLFTIDTLKQATLTGETSMAYRMCVVVKRRLQLYLYQQTKKEFLQLEEDINLSEIPKAIAWCQNTICVGYKGEYSLYTIKGEKIELFPTSGSKSADPCIVKASDTTFALGRENQTVLVNDEGTPEKSKVLKWSDVPTILAWDEPYCLALIGDSLVIQTIDSEGILQIIPDMSKVRFISRASQGMLYAASISQVWSLQSVDIAIHRKILLDSKQFQLALKLTAVSNESESEKTEIINQIQTLFAYDLFTKKQFNKSMRQFLKLKTNPYDVIRLFPDLLPQTTQAGVEVPESTSNLTERELEDGLQALIEYLTEVRFKHQFDSQQGNINASGNLNEKSLTNKNQQLLQIIDTTLLKCYLQTNDALVAPLLRSNHCHLAETERTLKKHGKHNELIILYQTKGQHRRALELLQTEGNVSRSIGYLQHLGTEHMGLILEFSEWVLNIQPDEGLKIFIEDLTEVEALPRPRILDYLLRSHASLVIPYLEHVVHGWEDTNPLFHDALVHKYREKALSEDPGATVARKKLLEFLEKSHHYTPDTVLIHFPTNTLLEERAVILGRLGKHEQALAIYVRALGDINRATTYCSNLYDSKSAGSQDVYVHLIKLILDPNSCKLDLAGLVLSPKTAQPDLEGALGLLEQFASRINPLSCISVLPEHVSVSRIYRFLQVALHESLKERRRVQLLKGLLYAEHLQRQEMRIHLESQSILISDMNVCPVCKKRFGNQSALVRYPNGDVVHYSCQDKKL